MGEIQVPKELDYRKSSISCAFEVAVIQKCKCFIIWQFKISPQLNYVIEDTYIMPQMCFCNSNFESISSKSIMN